jgi:hypothetical protein
MSYKQIPMFVTDDGIVFHTEDEAKQYDEYLQLYDWYDRNGLYGSSYGSRVEFDDLVNWLYDNKPEVRKLQAMCDFIYSLKE